MENVIIVIVLLAIIAAAIIYIVRAKKRGTKCIGCPAGGNCTNGQKGASGCSCNCGGESEPTSVDGCDCHVDMKE